MVRLSQYEEEERAHLLNLPCPEFATTPFITGTEISTSRVAIISTAGLHKRNDRPFVPGETGYRLIPGNVRASDLVMSHISTNFDRTGFQMDVNMILPLDRLKELVDEGAVGSVAEFHYSFMGATDPSQMEDEARSLAKIMKKDDVNAVLLVPV